jgi:CO/xanthine dehydrogenase FAD-binding subunit
MPLSVQTFTTLPEANAALHQEGARYLGGGTLTIRELNEGGLSFNTLVRSTDEELKEITVGGGSITLGASLTMANVAAHPALQSIAKAARAVGGPAIRNMATVGGNLFAPAPYGDFAVALLALDAVVCFGRRKVAMEHFLQGRSQNHDIVTSVRFALPNEKDFRFVKVTRVKPRGSSVLTVAAKLEKSADGTITQAAIALGCMAAIPIRARKAEQALVGSKLTERGVEAAVAAIREGIAPITDPVASSWYRNEVLPVHFHRLLLN